jgi:flagellar biosynthesis protein FliR
MDEIWHVADNPALKAALQMASLIFARIFPIIVLSPVFGGEMIPKRLRMGLGVVLSCALLPPFLVGFTTPLSMFAFFVLVAKEAVIGLTLGFILQMLFETISAVGALIDLGRGATLANILDPLTQNQQSILAAFFSQLGIVLFVSIGGLRLVMRALGDGFLLVRPQELVPASLVGPNATQTPIALVAGLFVLAFKLAGPVIVVIMLLDVALGVINRIAPQVHVFFLGMTIKGTLGMLILLLVFGMTVDLIVVEYAHTLELLRTWTSGAGSG